MARGNIFAERVMTVAHTTRKQDKNVLAFLTACCKARLATAVAPSLFAPELAAAGSPCPTPTSGPYPPSGSTASGVVVRHCAPGPPPSGAPSAGAAPAAMSRG